MALTFGVTSFGGAVGVFVPETANADVFAIFPDSSMEREFTLLKTNRSGHSTHKSFSFK